MSGPRRILVQVGVVDSLVSDGGGWTVAGDYPGLIRKREKPGVDGIDDLRGVSAGQISAANAALKQRVTGDKQVLRGEVQAD